MAGFREFVTGEVLTAANVNDFLMDQSVMKFADAAARDTALGTAVGGANALREGMVAYLDSTDTVQFFDGTVWDAISQPPAGIGSNVVQTVKTDVFSTSATSMTDITGFSVTITPTSASSKILVIADMLLGTAGNIVKVQMVRDSTDIYTTASNISKIFNIGSNDIKLGFGATLVFVDSPATTSSVTYKVQMEAGTNVVYLNRSGNDGNVCASSITAIEVAA